MEEETKEWFSKWFNTPYYHILYQDRDQSEAAKVIEQLKNKLNMQPKAKVLDLGCGRGRHSLYMFFLGYDVTGIDIAEQNIEYAKKFEDDLLHFYKHDMRKPFRSNYYDYVFNLFSSFGYFNTEKEHFDSIKYAALALKKDGILVIDFLNSEKIRKNYIKSETKMIDGIDFSINRFLDDKRITKTITFTQEGKTYDYSESVRLYTLEDFKNFFEKAGLKLLEVKGDYNMKNFKSETSPRLIMFAQKI
jgi:SAM-dependent methyltransferase